MTRLRPLPPIMLRDQLIRVSSKLDELIGELELGTVFRRNPHRDQDVIRDRVECLAEELRGAVRGVSFRPSDAPPSPKVTA